FKEARSIISKVQLLNHTKLPEDPTKIPVNIQEIILFSLPIADNSRTTK
ncbi:11731_t:CDS:1, partial [Dentiscutata heterogama]